MIKHSYKIADTVFEIASNEAFFHNVSKNYLSKEKAEFSISINSEDIEFEKSLIEDKKELESYLSNIGYLEYVSIQRKVTNYLLTKDIYLVHGVLLSLDSEGYFFIAASGVGKSTQAANWKKLFEKRAEIINGDKPFIKITKDGVIGYGSPWCGKEFLNINKSVKLKAIIGVTRGETNAIKKVSLTEIYPLLFQQIYKTTSKENISKSLIFLNNLASGVGFYILKCTKDVESAKVAYKGINPSLKFEDILAFDGRISYVTKGMSMLPLIREGKDISTIVRVNRRAKKNEVILYKRDNGQYVLHRVIKVKKDGYLVLGDNLFRIERNVKDRHVLGILESVDKGNNKIVRTDSEVYKKYVKKLTLNRPFRRLKLCTKAYWSAGICKLKKIFKIK